MLKKFKSNKWITKWRESSFLFNLGQSNQKVNQIKEALTPKIEPNQRISQTIKLLEAKVERIKDSNIL